MAKRAKKYECAWELQSMCACGRKEAGGGSELWYLSEAMPRSRYHERLTNNTTKMGWRDAGRAFNIK